MLGNERDWLPNTAYAAALLFARLQKLNWAGFTFLCRGQLVLGPFQGEPTCVRIAIGRGVCGTVVQRRATVIVPNVHEFPGHLACYRESNREIVVPLIQEGRLRGVVDLDSPELGHFDTGDQEGLEAFGRILIESTEWPRAWQ